MRIQPTRRWKNEEGASLLEFSFVAVLFIMVLLFVVELSRMVLVYTALNQAARAGTRYAIVHGGVRSGTLGTTADSPSGPTNYSQIQTVTKNFASTGLLNPNNVTVAVAYPDGTNLPGSAVTVTVSYTYDPLVSYFGSVLNKTMGSTSEGVIVF